ncbi:MAG: ATP-binding cassette domain-containing protein [Candidatus Cybelea sp.]|jgi:ABC-2 type transport system ATP-binding protein
MNSQTGAAVSTSALRKRYGDIDAIRGLSLEVIEGEIFGLIGPDGAGKTSTFQILAGILEPTSGTATIFGKPARDARSRTGYLTQTFSLYPDLSVGENIRYAGDLRLATPAQIAERGRRYLTMFGMAPFVDRPASKLSGGMRQKLSLICALVGEPRVLLLDEPTTGVDPVSRREFWDTLVHLCAEGLTILVATPYLDEAERCNRVAFMDRGQIEELGSPDELRAGLHSSRLELRTADLHGAQQALADAEKGTDAIVDVQRYGDHLDVLGPDAQKARQAVTATMQRAGLEIDELRADEPTLENVFVAAMRAEGRELQHVPFPARDDHSGLRGKIAIDGRALTRRFGEFVAVRNVALQVRYGEIYGLLGANGAGKTTTIKMLCGLLDPSVGSVQIAGAGEVRSAKTRQQIGYMPQGFSLYADLPIEENLEFFASVYGLPPRERAEKIDWVLAFCGLADRRRQITGSLPGGWKRQVAFGSAIMHEPPVLFLDEPTSGVDPLARRALWSLINQLADNGAAVLVTTHYLDEAEQCNRLGLMAGGQLIVEGSPNEIKRRQKGHLLELRVNQPQKAADVLRPPVEPWRVSLFGNRLHVVVDDDVESSTRDIRSKLGAAGIELFDVREQRFSLEDAFISAVERAAKDGAGSRDAA